MKTNGHQSLESVGFSVPTVARLKSAGIKNIGDLVAREESVTVSLIDKATKDPSIETLQLDNRIINSLIYGGLNTVPKLLNASIGSVIVSHNMGYNSLAQLIVYLVDNGHAKSDCVLLSKESVRRNLTCSPFYVELMRMDTKDHLSDTFKQWFNKMIEGGKYNTANRPNRKVFIKPFKTKK